MFYSFGFYRTRNRKILCCSFYVITFYNCGFVELEVDVLPTHDSDELTLYSHEKVSFYFFCRIFFLFII